MSTIDPDGRSGETVNDEYRAIHKSDGTVEYEWMSSEGGNERDIIHHTDEYAVPDKRHREWVEVVENPFGGLGERYKPGVWFSPLAKGTATVTDSPIEWVIDLPKVLAAKSAMLVLSLVKRGAAKSSTTAFRSFTSSNFRINLGRLTGNIPANSQAHHVFPKKYMRKFTDAGINIHNPKFGVWWNTSGHLKSAKAYNDAWGAFFRANPNPSQTQIFNYGRSLMQQYGIPVGF